LYNLNITILIILVTIIYIKILNNLMIFISVHSIIWIPQIIHN